MMFWIIAALVLFAAALLTFLPLLRGRSAWQAVALALVFAVPASGLYLYKEIGTPEAIGLPRVSHPATAQGAQGGDIDEMLASLRARLTETPEDLEGWILLARTLKTTEKYPEAIEALETAQRIAPDNAYVLVELVETRIYASPQGQITADMVDDLKRALTLEPGQQKALWLLGIASAQAGDYALAVEYWQSLLQQLEPGSTVAASVERQIAAAQQRMGLEPTPVSSAPPSVQEQPAAATGWPGIKVSVAAGAALQADMPAGAVLYVMVRSPGPAVGPPIGVRRINAPSLPLEITLTDKDSMVKERTISSQTEIQLQARLSLSGTPQATSGDWQSKPLVASLSAGEPVELTLDQQVE